MQAMATNGQLGPSMVKNDSDTVVHKPVNNAINTSIKKAIFIILFDNARLYPHSPLIMIMIINPYILMISHYQPLVMIIV